MSLINLNRRQFLSHSAKGATARVLAYSTFPFIASANEKSPNERLQFAAIGVGVAELVLPIVHADLLILWPFVIWILSGLTV